MSTELKKLRDKTVALAVKLEQYMRGKGRSAELNLVHDATRHLFAAEEQLNQSLRLSLGREAAEQENSKDHYDDSSLGYE